MAKRKFACGHCGAAFSGGRSLGVHYNENPDHRPAGKPKKVAKRQTSPEALLQQAFDAIGQQIAERRAMLSGIERIKAEITALENQQIALKKLLPQI